MFGFFLKFVVADQLEGCFFKTRPEVVFVVGKTWFGASSVVVFEATADTFYNAHIFV